MAGRRLTLYGKPDCHLCHEAKAMLARLQREVPFMLDEVDILSDEALHRRYAFTIPVIVIDGQLEIEAPIRESEVRAALR
ncbi:MAG: glutaredoxin family protein [Chloroflexi bacterium]|nr:glutaredoxin family protein [Chloroflexota bacterium]